MVSFLNKIMLPMIRLIMMLMVKFSHILMIPIIS
jgi:hypothetical protein